MMGRRDLAAASIAAVLCAILVALPVQGLRIAGALPLALLLPGYALTAAVFARERLDGSQLALLTISLSLATLIIGAVLLSATAGGLETASWAALLVIVVIGGSLTAARRRRRGPRSKPRRVVRPRSYDVLLLAGAVAVTAAASAIAWTPFPAKDAAGYTSLWILPPHQPGVSGVRVGVSSDEQDPIYYRLELQVDGNSPAVKHLALAPGEQRVLRFRRPASDASLPVRATLYRVDDPGRPYRQVRTWISAPNAPGPNGLRGPARP